MAQYCKDSPGGDPAQCTYDSDGKKYCIECHPYSALALVSEPSLNNGIDIKDDG